MIGSRRALLTGCARDACNAGAPCRHGRRRATIPNKPIRVIVGFAAGGGNDLFARLIQPKLTEYLGQNVIVENKPGAGGRLAVDYREEPAGRRLHHHGGGDRPDGDRGRDLSEAVRIIRPATSSRSP